MVRATVAICTRNRVDLIESSARHALLEATGLGGEVLVVDNGSTDGTSSVLATMERERGGELRVVFEPRAGLSAARNHALEAARCEVVAYIDDDAVPRPGWLRALLAPYDDLTVACVGGRIMLRFLAPRPAWVTPALLPALGIFDLGSAPRELRDRPGDEYPYGGNISFRTDAARALGGFSESLGLRGKLRLAHEETELCYRLDQAGRGIRYAPEAVVDHMVPAARLRPAWFLERHWWRGQSSAVFELRNRGLRKALGRIRWHYGAHLGIRGYAPASDVDPERFAAECSRREALGYLTGLVRWLPRFVVSRRDVVTEREHGMRSGAPGTGTPAAER